MDKPLSKTLEVRHIIEPAREAVLYIDGRRKGLIKSLRTPWKKYNQVSMQGIEWGSIHTIAGLSGSGKTAILSMLETNLAVLNPNEEFDILSFNFEMLGKNLIARKISSSVGKSMKELYSSSSENDGLSDDDYERVVEEAKKLSTLNIYYVDTAGSVPEIISTIESFRKKQLPGRGLVVLLDHTILVKGNKGELERTILVELMTAFNEQKKIGKTAFVVLSQLNRDIERAERFTEPSLHYPKKSDLFGSDSVYQFSDIVMVTMNPEQMGYKVYGVHSLPVKNKIYWHFLKVRFGEPCIAMMENQLKYSMVIDSNNV